MTGSELFDKPRRKCFSLHSCCLCHGEIRYGDEYHDGGFNRRAHEGCVAAALNEEAERESTGEKR